MAEPINADDDASTINGQPVADETAEQRASRLEEANKKLFSRAKTAEGFTQDPTGKWVKKPVEVKSTISEASKPNEVKPSDILKADEFKLYRAGYTETEIDLIMHNGGAKILEDKTNPLVLGLQAAKEQRGAEDAAGRLNDTSGLSDIERKYTEQDMRNMKKEDLEKLIPHVNK